MIDYAVSIQSFGQHARVINPAAESETIRRFLDVATRKVNLAAPDAPDETALLAVLNFAASLYDTRNATVEDGRLVSLATLWRQSGAEAMVKPWTVRRGGAIG